MVYAYIRISTEKQNVKNQRHEIIEFSKRNHIKVHKWIEETISTRRKLEERTFNTLLQSLSKDDCLIVSELSRVGRNLMQIMSVLHLCMERQVKVFAVKEGYELGDNINSKVLAFAFGLSAEIERNLISQRTKESLARLKAEGKILGRPKGSKKKFPILLPHAEYIRKRIKQGAKQVEIARELKVHRHTVGMWCQNKHFKNSLSYN